MAVATLVMRGKQYLVAVRPDPRVLVLETMYFADEVRDPATELPAIPTDLEFTDRELATATMLVDSMTTAWDPASYHDTYRRQVEQLIERKRKGEEVVFEQAPASPAATVDLVSVLEASLDAARAKGSPKKAPAAKAAAKPGTGRTSSTSRRKAS